MRNLKPLLISPPPTFPPRQQVWRGHGDNATRTFGSEFNLSAGTFFSKHRPFDNGLATNRGYLWYGTDAGNNRFAIRSCDTGGANHPLLAYGTGSAVISITPVATQTVNVFNKYAVAYGSTGGAISLNGATPVTDATASSISGFSAIAFGAPAGTGGFFWLQNLDYWSERKPNSELQARTA